jgi:PAS domain S-box-containing protein
MKESSLRILLIEDNPGDARLIRDMLTRAAGMQAELEWVETLSAGVERIKAHAADVVLLDLGLPECHGLDTVKRLLGQVPGASPVIVMSGLSDEDIAVRAVQCGAQDYLVKGRVDAALLARAIRYARERSQTQDALRRAHEELERRVAERTAELAHTVVALHKGILERKQTEELLRRSELEFRSLAENLPDVVIRYDRECNQCYANPACEREIGMGADNVQPASPGTEYLNALHRVIETGTDAEVFVHNPGHDGVAAYHAFHIVAEKDPEGRVTGALSIGRNVTALKETERRLKESQKLLRRLAARTEAVREEERKTLTREIHDEMGQYLSALRLGVSLIGLEFGKDKPALEEKTRKLVNLVDATIKVVRNVVDSLRPAALDMGIVPALEWLGDQFIERTGVVCTLRVDGEMTLEERRATEVFRIVQESLTNISRHAHATEVEVTLESSGTHYRLQVRDNGTGFDPAVRKPQSFGLVGMRERALALGGNARVVSAPDKGTTIEVDFPITYVTGES